MRAALLWDVAGEFAEAPVGWVALFNPTDPIKIYITQVYTAPTTINIGLVPFLHQIEKAL
jgi:hypothetical protein